MVKERRVEALPRLENTHGAPEGPKISVVIKKKMEPQAAVRVARDACLHSRSVTVEISP
jgi:hypothetical protein